MHFKLINDFENIVYGISAVWPPNLYRLSPCCPLVSSFFTILNSFLCLHLNPSANFLFGHFSANFFLFPFLFLYLSPPFAACSVPITSPFYRSALPLNLLAESLHKSGGSLPVHEGERDSTVRWVKGIFAAQKRIAWGVRNATKNSFGAPSILLQHSLGTPSKLLVLRLTVKACMPPYAGSCLNEAIKVCLDAGRGSLFICAEKI